MKIPGQIKLKRLTRQGIAKIALFSSLGILGVFTGYLVLLCHPGPFFRHAFSQGGVTLYSDEPIPASAGQVLEDVEGRLARSPLFRHRSAKDIRIYICNRKWRF